MLNIEYGQLTSTPYLRLYLNFNGTSGHLHGYHIKNDFIYKIAFLLSDIAFTEISF